jgi:hypothetical protein
VRARVPCDTWVLATGRLPCRSASALGVLSRPWARRRVAGVQANFIEVGRSGSPCCKAAAMAKTIARTYMSITGRLPCSGAL